MIDLTKFFISKNKKKDEAVNFQRFVEEKPLQRPVEEILSNLIERPSSEEAISLSEEEIVESARKLGYPLDSKTMGKIYAVQESSLPLFENIVTWLLRKEESEEPFYYVFARDGELLYDVLWGIGQANEKDLSKRVRYLKTSQVMEDDGLNSEYFNQIGISNSTIKNGNSLIFLDSGFLGSLFYGVKRWAKIKHNLFEKKVRGSLVRSLGDFDQLGFYNSPSDEIIKKFNEKMNDSPYRSNLKGDLSWDLCAFMQLMPKFTGRYTKVYQKENQNWDVLPEGNLLVSKLNINLKNSSVNPNSDQINSIKKDQSFINADIVDPVASLLLQKRTLEYFANPSVQDRVYSRIKTNSKGIYGQISKNFEKGYISFN